LELPFILAETTACENKFRHSHFQLEENACGGNIREDADVDIAQ
jgi:hypothetical protein